MSYIYIYIYKIDEEIIPSLIIDDHDRGIDCYFFNEDDKELYLIQNKYYLKSKSNYKHIIDSFLTRSLEHLNQKKYSHCEELQTIFSKYIEDPEFKIHMEYFSTEDLNPEISSNLEKWHPAFLNKKIIDAKTYGINEIRDLYHNGETKINTNLDIELYTASKYTRIEIDPTQGYWMNKLIESQFMIVSLTEIFKLVKKANDAKYSLFEENVREFIGKKGVNGSIVNTISEDNDEKFNFLFYNNGITIICDDLHINKVTKNDKTVRTNKTFIKNPQVVNGCQTVNSIYYALKDKSEIDCNNIYSRSYVMLKILKIPKSQSDLYYKIVKFNNSRNAIKEKDFTFNKQIFKNLQDRLLSLGFILIVRQSDKETFKSQNRDELKLKCYDKYFKTFDIEWNPKLIEIKLEKFLQILVAFFFGGYDAYTKKSLVSKESSQIFIQLLHIIDDNKLSSLILIYICTI